MTQTRFTLNGRAVSREIEPRRTLAEYLREECNLTALHLGCEHGACGACTVTIDGMAARSCVILAVMADGRDVRTVEGLGDDPVMARLRRAFHELHAVQCGFCTPGMLVTGRDILARHRAPDERTIRAELAGQICRCTGYVGIVDAIRRVGQELAEPGAADQPTAA